MYNLKLHLFVLNRIKELQIRRFLASYCWSLTICCKQVSNIPPIVEYSIDLFAAQFKRG